jgi:class 3 adenylate cyclase
VKNTTERIKIASNDEGVQDKENTKEDKYRKDADTELHDIREKQQIDILLKFFEASKNYCVCLVDIVESTTATREMSNEKISRYYGIFINMMAEIASSFGAIVVKNIGDSLLYYFPHTDSDTPESFRNVLICCFAMINSRPSLNKILIEEELPEISYRISCEYGSVAVARMSTSLVDDIFGMSVNMCSKINPLAPINSIIIGEGFYNKVKTFQEYSFEEGEINNYAVIFSDRSKGSDDNNNNYHVYIVKAKTFS